MGLKGELVRLAHSKPELRGHLLPVILRSRTASRLASMTLLQLAKHRLVAGQALLPNSAIEMVEDWLKAGSQPTIYVKAKFGSFKIYEVSDENNMAVEVSFSLMLENSFGKEQNWNYEEWRGGAQAKFRLQWDLSGPKPNLTVFTINAGRITFSPQSTPKATPGQVVAALATQNPKWVDPRKFEDAKYYREEKINDWATD